MDHLTPASPKKAETAPGLRRGYRIFQGARAVGRYGFAKERQRFFIRAARGASRGDKARLAGNDRLACAAGAASDAQFAVGVPAARNAGTGLVRVPASASLTERKFETAGLTARRLSSRETAEKRHLSEGGIRQYINPLCAGLGIAGGPRVRRQKTNMMLMVIFYDPLYH